MGKSFEAARERLPPIMPQTSGRGQRAVAPAKRYGSETSTIIE
jgi:hypothetical protein